MSINDTGVLQLEPGQTAWGVYNEASFSVSRYSCDLSTYLNEDCSELPVGSTLLVPTYRLEEVEEIIEPEKPGVPVEPYVGLSWTNDDGTTRVVLAVNCATIEYAHNAFSNWRVILEDVSQLCDIPGYPHTLSAPAVTRRQKKWVKIEHPEVPPND